MFDIVYFNDKNGMNINMLKQKNELFYAYVNVKLLMN